MNNKKMFLKLILNFLVLVIFYIFTTLATQAQSDYPTKPIQIIVAWSAGASEDLRNRALAVTMEKVLGQPVVVVNKPGAAGTLGLTLVAKAKPDGYTLGSASTSPILFAPHVQKVEYDSLKDFTYIAGTCIQPYGIVVRSDAPWRTFQEFINYVKENPGKIKYGSFGVGGLAHIYMEALAKEWNLHWVHVPFKGDAPNLTALLGGHVPISAASSAFVPHLRAGKLRLLALFTGTRMTEFPEVPTLKELGFKYDLRGNEVLGILGPKGLSQDIVKKLEKAIEKAVESEEFKKAMETLVNEAKFRDSVTFTKLIQDLYPQIGEMVKISGVKAE